MVVGLLLLLVLLVVISLTYIRKIPLTSRIIAICCGDIAAVLPVRSNISRKKIRKNIKLPYCCGFGRKPQQYIFNENIVNFFYHLTKHIAAVSRKNRSNILK